MLGQDVDVVVDILHQKMKQNHEDFVELNDCLRQLNGVLEPLLHAKPSDVPWALRERINRLTGYVLWLLC
jgi:hypothetical protein